jgi:acetylornithine deacetylase/succinyl-diaminopimelate desuccinylase-like protein
VFEVTNKGGHSSRPVPDNAIYHLARALDRVSQYEFPVQFNDANRGYFKGMAPIVGGAQGAAMTAILANPADDAARAVLDQDTNWHAMLRTTCVATTLNAGHATNALPQRATANVNCRIFPGVTYEAVRAQLEQVANDPQVKVSTGPIRGPIAPAAPLTEKILKPVKTVAAAMFPGVPVVPTMEPGASDAQFLNPAGIPTYGITGLFQDPDLGNIHGLNERVRVQSVYDSREFLHRLVKIYAQQ